MRESQIESLCLYGQLDREQLSLVNVPMLAGKGGWVRVYTVLSFFVFYFMIENKKDK